MEDEIVYQIDNPQQFWSELEDVIRISPKASLALLDGALRRFILLCASYHEQYLQAPLQFDHACELLLDSELFESHSGRMTNLLIQDATSNTDPHAQLILHKLLLYYGYRTPAFLRSQAKWKPLLPILMDHLLVDFDAEHEDWTAGSGPNTSFKAALAIPIEANLRILAVDVLYQVCRVQKFELQDLRVFDDQFISALFDLVEQTRDMSDDTLNYAIIKLIVALNEQFMVATLPSNKHQSSSAKNSSHKTENRVFVVLLRRLNFSRTFGQNMIFMLNRADTSISDDHCLQLLILKVLYLLFTTTGTQEYFYTNDLRVLVDVFIRNLSDIGDENDSLRHTYLRVLHPLLTNTQLKCNPYKSVQILRTLESLVDKADIRDVSSTTKRLVGRCLGGEWCANLRRQGGMSSPTSSITTTDSISDHMHHSSLTNTVLMTSQGGTTRFIITASSASASSSSTPTSATRPTLNRERSLKSSRSFGDLKRKAADAAKAPPLPPTRKNGSFIPASSSTGSSTSLISISAAELASAKNGKSLNLIRGNSDPSSVGSTGHSNSSPTPLSANLTGDVLTVSVPSAPHPQSQSRHQFQRHRDLHGYHHAASGSTPTLTLTASQNADPPKRRKPPPIPIRRTAAGVVNTRDMRSASVSAAAR